MKTFPNLSENQSRQDGNKLDFIAKEASFYAKMFTRGRFRVYHGISPLGAKTAILAKRSPLITTIHDAIPFAHQTDMYGGHQSWQAYERMCIRLCCQKSERIIFSSEFTKNYIRKEIEFDTSKARVIKYGIDHTFFSRMQNTEKKGKTIFSVIRWGKLEPLLNAFKSITKELPDTKLLLGVKNSFDRDKGEEIHSLLKKMDLDKSVTVIQNIPIDKLPSFYNDADVYISASLGGFSLTLLEAMACGTPVVAFNALDVSEYIEKDGVLVKPNDFQGLADETVRLLSKQKQNNNLSEEAVKKSLNFSWQKMASETIDVYNELR